MLFLRTRRGVGRVQLRTLSDREVAKALAPMHSGHVDVAPLYPPLDCEHGYRAAGGTSYCPACALDREGVAP